MHDCISQFHDLLRLTFLGLHWPCSFSATLGPSYTRRIIIEGVRPTTAQALLVASLAQCWRNT